MAAIIAALSITIKLAKRRGVSSDEVFDLAFYVIVFGLIGARLYAIFLDWPYYLANPGEIIAVWHGGLAIHGAILGGVAAAVIYSWRRQTLFWFWADLAAPGLALGQSIGRWGNYFNQEVFGRPTDLPWGIPIEFINRPMQYLGSQYFHPTFLYESILNVINFILLVFLFNKIYGKKQKLEISQPGVVFLVYLINYSLIRFGMEFLRVDETLLIFGVRWPIVFSLVLFSISLAAIGLKFLTSRKN